MAMPAMALASLAWPMPPPIAQREQPAGRALACRPTPEMRRARDGACCPPRPCVAASLSIFNFFGKGWTGDASGPVAAGLLACLVARC
ncbi:uncharacterized protein PSFLO_00003 [Pseudozyma flocculosa]|uniref:Uncharacterized protein n=1 Tax=Pseudozyma flocculosa TaxID=84751 RepID=A0A5C3EQY3_9BASI|nr:uncharacterized protein PSFLO_00003 [Pseudozyma flocculosa]